MDIAVLGSGTWGTALAMVLAKANPKKRILFWGRSPHTKYLPDLVLPKNIEFSTDLLSVVKQVTDLLFVVPSSAFTSVLETIIPELTNKHRIAWATKGLDPKTGKFFSQSLADLLKYDLPIAVISGPSFAKEVIADVPTAIVIAHRAQPTDQLFVNDLITRLHSKTFRIYTCNDLIGVQLGGVFKNILAVAAGICEGLGFGANTRAALITRGLAEILRLADKLGAQRQTLMGLSGLGDIFLSCTDNQSRNRKFGLLLATGKTIEQAKLQIGQVVEAIDNIPKLYNLAIKNNVYMPIVNKMWQVIYNKLPLLQAVEDLLIQEPQEEWL